MTYLIGWVLQFTLSNLLSDNWVFLPQIHFDGIEIDEVGFLAPNQLFEQMTSQVYAEKKAK